MSGGGYVRRSRVNTAPSQSRARWSDGACNTEARIRVEGTPIQHDLIKYYAPLRQYLSKLVGSAEDALDLVQETYARVLPHCDILHTETVVRAYLYRAAANIAHEYHRRRIVRRYKDHLPVGEIELVSLSADPEKECLLQERQDRLAEEMDSLPALLMDVIKLKYFERRNHMEIASMVGVCTRTVERRIARATELLSERMYDCR